MLKEELEQLKSKAEEQLNLIKNSEELENFRISILSKKGELTSIMKKMGSLSAEERPIIGKIANEVRNSIESAFSEKSKFLEEEKVNSKLSSEKIDVTMPGKIKAIGKKHPLTQIQDSLCHIFRGMGFDINEGPEIETDYYNFEALNTPADHPARDVQDTFYITDNLLLRTQTSSVQIRTMNNTKPPIRMVSPGRVYRSDAVDATHSPMFHQIEGLVVDKGITMGDLKGTLESFAKSVFGDSTKVRFRPHHFPFTEPSAEMDVSCFACHGKGVDENGNQCRVCHGETWIEILGCGMVHPNVLKGCDIDPEEYSGFAFGMGIERICMVKYGITDMRLLYENNIRFLDEF